MENGIFSPVKYYQGLERMKKILFTVTNDLSYDQRMIRICTSLSVNGFHVQLVGRKMPASVALSSRPFEQVRLNCFFNKGKLFYAEYNLRLFFYLLTQKMHCICAIDLDTILPCYLVSSIRKVTRVYDAHELFCEMKEIVSRPFIYRCWKSVEKFAVPGFMNGYTVNRPIANEFEKMYGVKYEVIRSITVLSDLHIPVKNNRFILYQGSVNEGRSFETLIPAMKEISSTLVICGDGNFMQQAKQLALLHGTGDKVLFRGKLEPALLKELTVQAWIGTTLFENNGLSNYLSLANRFFDYIHAGVPQLCVNYPAYREINNLYEVAVLIDDLRPETIARNCNRLLTDDVLYARLQENCIKAREFFNWQKEEKKLLDFYYQILA
jgi:glycosyltransferase involved in cell wall biosynthesis